MGKHFRSIAVSVLALTLATAVCFVLCTPAQAEARLALLVANHKYKSAVGELDNPPNDIRLVGKAIESSGFQVLSFVENGTREGILEAVYNFASLLAAKGPEAIGLFYYSGHGVAAAGENYLLPVDLDSSSSNAIAIKGVRLGEIGDVLQARAPGAAHYLVFDACRNNLRGARGSKGFVPVQQRSGALIAFSTAPDRTATDMGTLGSPYAVAFARELTMPGQDDLAMFHRVKIAVIDATGGEQVPWIWDGIELRDRVRFAPQSAKPTVPQSPVPESDSREKQAAARFWEVARINSCTMWKVYLDEYADVPNWGARAKSAISDLRCDASPQTEAALSPGGQPSTNPVAPRLLQDLVVAVNGPMTGAYAEYGNQLKVGAEAAAADINASGGLLGRKIKLELGDDACDPKQARGLANKTAGLKPALVAGHFCSGSSIPASEVYTEANLVQISPGSTDIKFTDQRPGPSIFRVSARDDQQGVVAGAYIARNFANKKVAIVHDKSIFGRGIADETRATMSKAGKKEVMYEAITTGERDYTDLVGKLKHAGIDLVFFGGYHTEAGLIVRQMRSNGMKTILLGGDQLATRAYWQITGADGEGTLMLFPPDVRRNPAATDVVRKFRAAGVEPEGFVLYTYAAIQAWKQAVERAGSTDTDKVVKAMESMEFSTVVGQFRFDRKGDPSLPPYAIYQWSKGAYGQL